MHEIAIPEDVMARGLRLRGGRRHIIEMIDPARTAHVVVDLQNGFMAEGAPVEVPVARKIVGDVNRISDAVRRAGGLNVFLRYTYDAGEPLNWSAFYGVYAGADSAAMMRDAFSAGSVDHELWPGLDVDSGVDLVVDKTRFSAFIPGTCGLDAILRERGIDTLIVTGTLTNCCCESTARDAMQMNYKIVFVADGNATLTDGEHNATLANMTAIFADVMTTDEVVALAEAAAETRSAA